MTDPAVVAPRLARARAAAGPGGSEPDGGAGPLPDAFRAGTRNSTLDDRVNLNRAFVEGAGAEA